MILRRANIRRILERNPWMSGAVQAVDHSSPQVYCSDFLEEIDRIVSAEYPTFEIVWFGHIGDGNLHLNILKPADLEKAAFFERCAVVNKWVFETVQKYNGSISAEHGVGMTKKAYLQYSRSPEEVAYMKAIKQVFDPNNVMNPGKIFD